MRSPLLPRVLVDKEGKVICLCTGLEEEGGVLCKATELQCHKWWNDKVRPFLLTKLVGANDVKVCLEKGTYNVYPHSSNTFELVSSEKEWIAWIEVESLVLSMNQDLAGFTVVFDGPKKKRTFVNSVGPTMYVYNSKMGGVLYVHGIKQEKKWPPLLEVGEVKDEIRTTVLSAHTPGTIKLGKVGTSFGEHVRADPDHFKALMHKLLLLYPEKKWKRAHDSLAGEFCAVSYSEKEIHLVKLQGEHGIYATLSIETKIVEIAPIILSTSS